MNSHSTEQITVKCKVCGKQYVTIECHNDGECDWCKTKRLGLDKTRRLIAILDML